MKGQPPARRLIATALTTTAVTALALLAVLANETRGGVLTADSRPDSALWYGRHSVEVRWLHGKQRPDLTRFDRAALDLRIDSLSTGPVRDYTLRTRRRSRPGRLTIRNGRTEAWVAPPDLSRSLRPGSPLTRTVQYLDSRLTVGDAVVLDDARLWDIAPPEPPALRSGATGRDTLRLRAERFGFLQSMEGPRVTTLLRDTLVDGRRLWIGRDSARIRYRERLLHWRRSLDTTVVVERVATGTLRGRFLYDPDLGLFLSRSDTLEATGAATLRRPDGVVHRTPARYERRVEWTLRSPAAWRAWREEERSRRKQNAFSIVMLPRTELQEWVARGDSAAADSLLRAWRDAGPDQRSRIAEALLFAPRPVRERLDSLKLEAGGWIARVGTMTRRVWAGPPLDTAEMREYLKLLRDPGLAFDYGMDTDPAYENLAGGLALYPPTLDAPTRRTACTPAACRLVAEQGDAEEPRLRQVAMVARFILEPERWADSLLARSDTGSHLLHRAVMLARGVGATWPAAEKRPMPAEGADWRAWRRWSGIDDRSPVWHGDPPLVEFRESHVYAVRMVERLTGRDIGAELRAGAKSAESDSARAVFRSLWLRLGAIEPSLDEVLAGLESDDPLDRALAFTALERLSSFRQPADSALAAALAGQLLAQAVDGDTIWSVGEKGSLPQPVERDSTGPTRPLYLAEEHLPAAVRAHWEGRDAVEVISREAWERQPPRSPGTLLVVHEVMSLGPLAWVGLGRWARQARGPDEAPRAWGGGAEFLLLRTDEGWRVLRVLMWAT